MKIDAQQTMMIRLKSLKKKVENDYCYHGLYRSLEKNYVVRHDIMLCVRESFHAADIISHVHNILSRVHDIISCVQNIISSACDIISL